MNPKQNDFLNSTLKSMQVPSDAGSEGALGRDEMEQIVVALETRMKRKQDATQKRLQAEFNQRMEKGAQAAKQFYAATQQDCSAKLNNIENEIRQHVESHNALLLEIQNGLQSLEKCLKETGKAAKARDDEIRNFQAQFQADFNKDEAEGKEFVAQTEGKFGNLLARKSAESKQTRQAAYASLLENLHSNGNSATP